MSDNVSNEMQGECMDFIDWDEVAASGWVGVDDDAACARATDAPPHAQAFNQPGGHPLGPWVASDADPPSNYTRHYSHWQISDPEIFPDLTDQEWIQVSDGPARCNQDVTFSSSGLTAQRSTPLPFVQMKVSIAPTVDSEDSGVTFDGLQIESGGGAANLDQSSELESSVSARKRSSKATLSCPHNDCTHHGTFRRHYELDRHIRVKHQSAKPFSCPYQGCFKGEQAPKFARSDKLTAHIRTAHRRQHTRKLKCPSEGCADSPKTLDLMGMHIRKRHSKLESRFCSAQDHSHLEELLRAISNAASTRRCHCPVWNCSQTPKLQSVQQHLLSHTDTELEQHAAGLASVNYAPINEPDRRIIILCPVCKTELEDHTAFEDHFNEVHAIAEHHRSHFRVWQHYARGITTLIYSAASLFKPWDEWSPYWFSWNQPIKCPDCDYTVEARSWPARVVDHHIGMLADPAVLKPYRLEILKLYPDFESHPVWDDMA